MNGDPRMNGEIATVHDWEQVVGVCGWCWRSTTLVLESAFSGTEAPLHVTCVMQMNIVRKRIDKGWAITGRTLAERRYLRLVRIAVRNRWDGRGLLEAGRP
jgi:hypothetical protein